MVSILVATLGGSNPEHTLYSDILWDYGYNHVKIFKTNRDTILTALEYRIIPNTGVRMSTVGTG